MVIKELIKNHPENMEWATLKDIEPKSPVSRRTLDGYLKQLVEDGFLIAENMEFIDKNGRSYHAVAYSPIMIDQITFPTKKEVQKQHDRT